MFVSTLIVPVFFLIKFDSHLQFQRAMKEHFYVFGAEGAIFSTAVISLRKITDF